MAYLRDITPPMCQSCRRKKATRELVNNRNAPCGQYCTTCGQAAKERLVKQENA